MEFYFDKVVYYMDRMDTQQWVLVLAIAIAAGIFLLRGFGSRSSY